MNADPADTRFPHLDLAELIAEATGQAAGDRVREHLASCEQCRAEANRWNLVADGIRGLASATPEMAQPARLRHAGLHMLADPRRRNVLAAGAAAALVILGGVGYGAAAALTEHASSTAGAGARAAVLTSVSGCAGLKQASGTLEQVNGDNLIIETPGGQPVTVTTTASTLLSVSGAPLSDVTDGAPVTVMGSNSDGAIAANNVSIGKPKSVSVSGNGVVGLEPKSGSGPVVKTKNGKGVVGPTKPVPNVIAQGTVSDAGTAGFTVVTSSGTRVQVTTSGETVVNILHASLGQLQAGATTIAVGYVEPDGTLSATAVLQPRPKPGSGKLEGTLEVNGCSPASIDTAITTALASGN